MKIPNGLTATERQAWINAQAAIIDIKNNFGRTTPTAKKVLTASWIKMRRAAEILGIALPFQSFNEAYSSALHLSREMDFIGN
jgi:hypothetical protein